MSILTDALILQNYQIQLLLDVLLKSFLILSMLLIIVDKTRHKMSSSLAHGLLLTGLIIVALLPLGPTLMSFLPGQWQTGNSINVFVVTQDSTSAEEQTTGIFTTLLFGFYGLVVTGLLFRLAYAFTQLCRIHAQSEALQEPDVLQRFMRVKDQLQIRRNIDLRKSMSIGSPVSYGLIRPTVLVPADIASIPGTTQTEIFTHELSHVKRFDWLTLLFTRILCSLLWINPMLWIVARKLHDEAEQVCDSAIIETEEDRVRYAENLLDLAKLQKAGADYSLLAQPMYDGGDLTMRIKNILEGKLSRGLPPKILAVFGLAVVTFSIATSGIKLFAAESEFDQDYIPVSAPSPMYPTRAAEEEIEGWVLVSFTVRADGVVDPNTITVVDAEPAGYFENNSIRAAERFEFEPRIKDGLAVDVPGVQYLFRFKMHE